MLHRLVVERLVLDLACAGTSLHRAQHAAALGDALELRQHGLFDQVGQLLDDEEPCSGFSFLARPSSLLMISWIASARRTTLFGRRGDGLVVGVGVQELQLS